MYFHLSKTLRHNAEEEQLRSSLHQSAYNDHSNQGRVNPPKHRTPVDNEQHEDNQKQQGHSSQITSEVTRNPPTSQPSVNKPDDVPLNNNNVNFLVAAIRDLLREDLKKELSSVKVELNHLRQVQALTNQQIQLPMLYPLPQKNAAQLQIPTPQAQPQVSQQPQTQSLSQIQAIPNILISNPQTI